VAFGKLLAVEAAAVLAVSAPAGGATLSPSHHHPKQTKYVVAFRPTTWGFGSEFVLEPAAEESAHVAALAAQKAKLALARQKGVAYEQAVAQAAARQSAQALAVQQAALALAQQKAIAYEQAVAQVLAAQQAAQAKVVPPDNPVDATSTDTPDWACIRQTESSNHYADVSGAYGILVSTWAYYGFSGVPGQAPPAVQDAFALKLFALNGYKFAGAWNDPCTMNGGPLK
jgi:hypothetical protein